MQETHGAHTQGKALQVSLKLSPLHGVKMREKEGIFSFYIKAWDKWVMVVKPHGVARWHPPNFLQEKSVEESQQFGYTWLRPDESEMFVRTNPHLETQFTKK